MKLDLDHIAYTKAIAIIKWCIANDVDSVKAMELAHAINVTPVPNVVWELEIPEQYIPWMMLQFDLEIIERERIGD